MGAAYRVPAGQEATALLQARQAVDERDAVAANVVELERDNAALRATIAQLQFEAQQKDIGSGSLIKGSNGDRASEAVQASLTLTLAQPWP